MKRIKTNSDEMESNETEQSETEKNPLYFRIPLTMEELLAWCKTGLATERGMTVEPVDVSMSKGMAMIGVLPVMVTK
jgi:hypothetical protein